jgi:hypothetical protein
LVVDKEPSQAKPSQAKPSATFTFFIHADVTTNIPTPLFLTNNANKSVQNKAVFA